MNKWIAHELNTQNSGVNLICFPFAGGTASYFAQWGSILPEGFGLMPVLYPMRELRYGEKMPETINELADLIASEAKEIFEKPFILFGHCTGALIAYRLAEVLQEKYDIKPLFLTVLGQASPDKTIFKPEICEMTDKELTDFVVAQGMLDKEMAADEDFMEYYFPAFSSDYKMHHRSAGDIGRSRLSCPVVAINGDDDPYCTDEMIKAWSDYTDDFSFYEFKGDHKLMNDKAPDLLKIISKKYNEITGGN